MKKWYLDSNTQTFRKENKVITHEQFLNYQGKYNYATDLLLDAIYELHELFVSLRKTNEN